MNDFSSTPYCSGSESGWTMYLDQSNTSDHHFQRESGDFDEKYRKKEALKKEEEDEDLSMVSDASSGPPPPHYHENNEEWFYNKGYYPYPSSASESVTKEEKKKKKMKQNGRNQQHSYLDDTASSPVYGSIKKNSDASSNEVLKENAVDFSQGFSATHFKTQRKSSLRKHFSFYGSEKSASQE